MSYTQYLISNDLANDASKETTIIPATPGITQTWQKPAGVTYLIVECWGAGGAGGYVNANNSGGSGGGGGAYSKKTFSNLSPDSYNISFQIGAPGSSSLTPSPFSNAGGDTWFISNTSTGCLAKGGSAGLQNNGASVLGGQAASGFGDITFSGGSSGQGVGGTRSGGGGGGAGSTGAGGNASTTAITAGIGTTIGGGDGGAGSTTSTIGLSGNPYGGGGGGAYGTTGGNRDRAGGVGAAGAIQVAYYINTTTFIDLEGDD